MKKILFTLTMLGLMIACGEKDVRKWSEKEIEEWFNSSKWNELSMKPDATIDQRQFVEQNVLNPQSWDAAFKFLKEGDFEKMELGRVDLSEDGTYANIQEYTTHDSLPFEAHRKYIDIQYIVSGKECVYITSLENISEQISPFKEKEDYELFEKEESTAHILDGSNFMVFFPSDGHKPGMKVDSNEFVRKVVIKIPLMK